MKLTFKALNARFDQCLEADYYQWKEESGVHPQKGTRYLRNIRENGGVKAFETLLVKGNRDEWGGEYFVAHPYFKRLFTPEQREIARLRMLIMRANGKFNGWRWDFRKMRWVETAKLKLVKKAS